MDNIQDPDFPMNSEQPHIVFLTSGHSPFSSRLFYKELKTLKKKVNNLTIIAPSNQSEDNVDGIRVICVPKKHSRYNRWHLLKNLFKQSYLIQPSIIHCHEPDSLFIAYLLKRRNPRIRVIYDCHEFHPQSFTEYFPAILKRLCLPLIDHFEKYLAKRADAVITVNNMLVDNFKQLNSKTVLLPNYPILEVFKSIKRNRKLFQDNEIRLIYTGNISIDRGIIQMIEVMKALKSYKDIKLILVGKFSSNELKKKIFELISKYNLNEKIIYKGFLPHKDTLLNLMGADIGLFLIADRKRYRWGEPIKYFEYSAAGLPVIMSDLPAKRALLEKNENGIAVSHENINQTVKAITYLIHNPKEARKMSENGYKAFLNQYNWESIEHRLLDLYDQLL